jgi:uncharacterized surface protein with fasciclin (FAS1) repeats
MKNNSKTPLKIFLPLFALFIAMGFSSCNNEDPMPIEPEANIVEVAGLNANFSTLVAAVQQAGLVETLSSPGPFTVFAPTNDAFNRFLADNNQTADQLLNSDGLATVLNYHVIAAEVPSSAVTPGRVNSAAGIPFFVSVAPDNSIWINGSAQIVQTDVSASNGLIHVLDYVIVPPTQNIAQIAISATEGSTPEFTHLVAALVRADLASAVSGGINDDFTVFAPTDAAFEALFSALGVGSVDEIPLETLTNVLLYHVVPARAFSQDLRNGAALPTLLEGETLTVNLNDLKINESGLVESALNIHAINGVIHAIDTVLLPG